MITPPPADELVVRLSPMRPRHLRAVLRIESAVYPRPWSLGLFSSELAMRNSRVYLVARASASAYFGAGADTAVVGYGGLMMVADEGHVTTLAVDPAWQRRGVATRLLLALAREAIGRNAEGLTLEVRMSNAAARRLYARFGFVPAGIRPRYYEENNEDALVMWAHEIATPEYLRRLEGIESTIAGSTLVSDQP